MADNFEQLGFQVKVDGADSAVSNLDRIEKRLANLEQTTLSVKKAQISLANAQLSLANSQKAYENAQRSATNAENARKNAVIGLENAQIRLNAVLNNQKATQTQILLAQNGLLSAQNSLNSALNTEISAQANVDKARNQLEKSTNAVTTAELNLQNAIDKEKEKQDKASQAIKNKVNVQEQEEKQTKRNTQSLTSYISKLTSTVVIARKFAHIISSSIQESADYIENLNLFAVAYGEAYQEQLDWALGIAKAYGLANNEVLKFAGTFRELSTSLGLVSDTADLVSETVTNLGYDLAALFNTTVEQAMEKLQSGIFSGNVRPLRAYGIDISQNQIDALFETNEALRQLGVNAKNLSQSDKVLARLIITLQSGKDSFGTMAREINNLQSQFRIFQGSLANFKLAIGDLVNKPLSQAMVYVNGFIIAMTNVIRAFVPLKTIDETPVGNLGAEADEASQALDNLNGKLADFDKFNVLQQGEESSSSLAITEALNKLLLEQSEIYKSQLGDLTKIGNKATEVAKKITDFFIEIEGYDEEGNAIYGLTDQIELLIGVLGTLISMKVYDWIFNLIGSTKLATGAFNLMATASNVLAGVGLFLLISNTIDLIKNWDKLDGKGKAIRITMIAVGGALTLFATLTKIALKNTTLLTTAFKLQKVAAIGLAVGGIGLLVANLTNLIGNWDELNGFEKVIGIFGAIGAAALAAAAAVAAFQGSWTLGTAIPAIVGGLLAITAAFATFKKNTKELSQSAHANGGYTNANLIMTHENGKREWVGKAAGSSAIVNDTQMSDIMEVAVAKGVVLGNRALGNQGSDGSGVIHNHIYLDGKQIYEGVTDTAKKYGKKWATV